MQASQSRCRRVIEVRVWREREDRSWVQPRFDTLYYANTGGHATMALPGTTSLRHAGTDSINPNTQTHCCKEAHAPGLARDHRPSCSRPSQVSAGLHQPLLAMAVENKGVRRHAEFWPVRRSELHATNAPQAAWPEPAQN